MNIADSILAVSGMTGTWGTELAKQLLLTNVKEIRAFSRGETAQANMSHKFNDPRLKFIVGDIRDLRAVTKAFQGVDYVFNFAAMKHIPICEKQPDETIKTNICGVQNVIEACIANKVIKCVNVSTDKVADPITFYGRTKAIGEALIVAANNTTDHTSFINVRSGNILGSNGSVIPLFVEQIRMHNKITITSPEMTRFFIPATYAIKRILKAMEVSSRGETFIYNMPCFRLKDLAEVIIEHYGNKDTEMVEIGTRGGEKLDEMLLTEFEAKSSYIYDKELILLLPIYKINGTDYESFYGLKDKQHSIPLHSGIKVRDKDLLVSLLQESGYCL